MNTTFDPQTLADDLSELTRIYARFFAALDEWRPPGSGSRSRVHCTNERGRTSNSLAKFKRSAR